MRELVMVLELVVNNAKPLVREVQIDAHPAHPTVVFFQDAETRFTIAVERVSGKILGHSGEYTMPMHVQRNVLEAVKKYKQQCKKALQE